MSVDPSYSPKDLAITSRTGMVVGIAAAFLMLAVIYILKPMSGMSYMETLRQVGGSIIPASKTIAEGTMSIATGLCVHLLLGALFGVLYAACQQRVPIRGLIAVGIFYGFVLWILGSLIAGPLFTDTLKSMICSWSWLTACMIYGLGLAMAAVWSEKHFLEGDLEEIPKD